MCPPLPQFYPQEQQQELLQEEPQRRTSARQYFPKYSTWQRLCLKDQHSQECYLGLALVGFLQIIPSLCFTQ